jgi:hypothetical protein
MGVVSPHRKHGFGMGTNRKGKGRLEGGDETGWPGCTTVQKDPVSSIPQRVWNVILQGSVEYCVVTRWRHCSGGYITRNHDGGLLDA